MPEKVIEKVKEKCETTGLSFSKQLTFIILSELQRDTQRGLS